ncbi:rubredoxin [Methanocella sp. CWC-04]|uniref:Rubredoxin n=1 Tax=Methanooceanicella nereidis TaxID=2052831 RepID=A0AAP2RFF7_9EURY|nr:hypothetical protein [Methanocella sp. CWC-04]MCD1296092.1 rubredoxin [Methanocella sp. CWC-04]
MLYSFKCKVCGNVTKAAIRPHLCPGCKARRSNLEKIERENA